MNTKKTLKNALLAGVIASGFVTVSCNKEEIKPAVVSTPSSVTNASNSTKTEIEIFQFETLFGGQQKIWKGSNIGDSTTQAICEINDSLALLGLESKKDNFYFTFASKEKKFNTTTIKKSKLEMFASEIFILEDTNSYFVAKEDDSIAIQFSKIPTGKGGILKGTFQGKVSRLDQSTFQPAESKVISGSFTAYRIK